MKQEIKAFRKAMKLFSEEIGQKVYFKENTERISSCRPEILTGFYVGFRPIKLAKMNKDGK